MPRFRLTSAAVAFLLIAPALLFVGRQRMLRDPGTLWHTVVGEQIIETRALPRVDTFTFTHAGEPWIAQQWLAEIAMAGLHRVGGLDALLLAAVCLLAATYAFTFGRLMRRGVCGPVAGLLIAIVIAGSSFHFLARPHLLTIAFSAVLYALLCDVDAGRVSKRRLWLLVPLLVLWTNVHGGALGGLATVVIWLLICNPKSAIRNLPLAAACLVAPLLNPYGLALPHVWFALMQSKLVPLMIQEHAPPGLLAPETWMLALLAAIYVAALLLADPKSRKPAHFLPLVWAALSVTRIRHGPIFAVMVPIALAELLPGSRIDLWLRERGSDLLSPLESAARPPRRNMNLAAVACIILAMGLSAQHLGLRLPLIGAAWARLDPSYWPVGALPALRAELSTQPDQPNVFNETIFGGFITYFTPQARTFIDDRCELLGDDGLRQYAELAMHPDRLNDLLRTQRVRLALVSPASAFDRWFANKQEWRVRYSDAAAVLYAHEAMLEK